MTGTMEEEEICKIQPAMPSLLDFYLVDKNRHWSSPSAGMAWIKVDAIQQRQILDLPFRKGTDL